MCTRFGQFVAGFSKERVICASAGLNIAGRHFDFLAFSTRYVVDPASHALGAC
jgi:hypothetical protein